MNTVKFQLGRLLATPEALEAIAQGGESVTDLLTRHAAGDWGVVDAEDAAANEAALLDGSRILSVYFTAKHQKLYVITEATDDEGRRAATTITLAEEY